MLFNTRSFSISGVAGLNTAARPTLVGTCATCHNTPDVGGNSGNLFVDIGISDGSRRTPDMPLYTIRNIATGQTVQTTDPGLALSTGKWADIGRFKVPNLRSIGARSPYFHGGSRSSVEGVVGFYNARFGMRLTPADQADLVAFIKAL